MVGCFVLLLGVSLAVSAPPEPDTSLYVFPPVTVRALRSSALTAAEPYAWTYRSAETWQLHRSYGVEEALQWIPGVLVQDRAGNGDVRIVIRGFGARGAGDRSNNGTTRGVRILLDGIPLTEPDGRTALDLLEPSALGGVEVLRSNGTLLWGNASGGVIAFHTLPPSPTVPLTASASMGSFGFRRTTVQFVSASGGSLLSIAGAYSTTRGWRQNAEGHRWWATLGWRSSLNEQTLLEFRSTVTGNFFAIPGPLDWETFLRTPTAANPTYQQQRAHRHNRIGSLSFAITSSPAAGQHLHVTTFLQPKVLTRSERGTYREFSRIQLGGSVLYQYQRHLSQSTTAALTLGSDIAFQDGPATFYRLTADGGRDSVIRQHKREAALNAGFFGRLQWDLASQYTLWAGLRSEWLLYRLIDALRPTLSDRILFRALLPSAGVGYRPSDRHSFYLHISSGWEVPAYNELDPPPTELSGGINPQLKPMKSWTAEIGSRHHFWLLRRWAAQLELALYWIDSRNELVPYGGGRFYQNAAHSERVGTELLLSTTWNQDLTVQLLATLNRMRYRSYRVDSTYLGSSGQAEFSHHYLPGIPSVRLGARATYTWGQLQLGTELSYTGSYYADDANTVEVPSHTLWHIRLQMAQPLRLAGLAVLPWVEVRNVTNRRYIGSVYINPDRDTYGRPLYAEPGMPRALTVGVQLHAP